MSAMRMQFTFKQVSRRLRCALAALFFVAACAPARAALPASEQLVQLTSNC